MPDFSIPVEELRKCKLFLATPMFGGNCAGVFARATADLAALCTHYGITLQMYFLFNESLITRARNYCCDEFMRSEATHFMFIDSDIGYSAQDVVMMMGLMKEDSPYDVLGGPYPKKSQPGVASITTENGIKTLKDIVNNKYSGRVLSLSSEGKFEWKKVINWFVDPSPLNKKWVAIGRWGRKKLVCTNDHECYYISNPLCPLLENCEAKDLEGKYIVKKPISNGKNSINPLYNHEQLSCLIGTMFGDGSIRKGYLGFGHSNAQYDYLELKQKLFGGKIYEEKKIGSYKGKDYFAKYLECPRNAQIEYLQTLFYPNKEKKTIKNVIDFLDEKGLAFWYMDDGSLRNNSLEICSEGFSYDDHMIIQKYLKDKWSIEITIRKLKDKWRIYIEVDSSKIVFQLIAPYIHASMEYKLPKEYRGKEKYQFNYDYLDYAAELVNQKDIKYIDRTNSNTRWQRHTSKQYDITVEDNFNFVSSNYVTHNCISFEKVKMAVDKGFADKNPNDLEKYIGDYVFNPKGGQTSIPVNEPVEVLELGTGFMMIKKSALTKFQTAYPQYMYKPDHVRTTQFDGSREIMQFFQAEIEPEGKRYLSEDYWFTRKAQSIGLRTWLLPWVKLQHVGTYIFGGSLLDLAALGAPATCDPNQLVKNS